MKGLKQGAPRRSRDGTALGVCGGLLLAAAVCWAGPPASRSGPAWTARPALTAQLGPEVKIGVYGIRPPRGYTLRPIQMQAILGNGSIYVWSGPMRADRTAANFMVMVGQDASGMMRGMNSPSFVRLEMSSMTRSHSNVTTSPIQSGTIHGLPFARASWQGIGPRTGKAFAGFFYGQAVMPNLVMMQAKDEAPAAKATMPLFQAAALSLHKL